MSQNPQVSRIESFGPGKSITTIIQIDIDREVSEDESRLINDYNQKIHSLLRLNDYKNDPKTKIQIEDEKFLLMSCFPTPHIYVRNIKNQYTLDNVIPWYQVTTSIGNIIIGWRKRVINIDWSDSEQTLSADELFPNEDVTKIGKSIHAWGYDKAREYLNKILITL